VGVIDKVDMAMHTPETRFFDLGIMEPYARHGVWRQPRRTIVSQGQFVKLGMAVAMMGMMGAGQAQTIDQNWVRQNADNPRQARQAISYANNTANVHERINASPTRE
jgi:hypothetical protein